jgi:hypothetical protein
MTSNSKKMFYRIFNTYHFRNNISIQLSLFSVGLLPITLIWQRQRMPSKPKEIENYVSELIEKNKSPQRKEIENYVDHMINDKIIKEKKTRFYQEDFGKYKPKKIEKILKEKLVNDYEVHLTTYALGSIRFPNAKISYIEVKKI